MPSSPAWYSESGKVYTRKLPQGRPCGWGIAEYTTPETQLGPDFVTSAYQRKPEGSRERILAHLRGVLPEVPEKRLLKLI